MWSMFYVAGDIIFHSSRRMLSQQLSASGLPVFAYHFTDSDAVTVAEFAPSSFAPGSIGGTFVILNLLIDITKRHAVSHTSEIPYVFGTLMNKTPKAMALSAIIQNYWISFVNNLNPNDNHGEERRSLIDVFYI